jgi:glycosyltransferase involved in cell wall biosynthesis
MTGPITVIIPTLNAARQLPRTLASLSRADGLIREVIVADGGSRDATLDIAEAAGCTLIAGEPNRARLFRLAAAQAKGRWLLFLHQGAVLGDGWSDEVQNFFATPDVRRRAAVFRLAFAGSRRALFWARLRTRLTKLPRGDQGLLISRFLYDAIGGYQDLKEFEDADIIRRIGAKRLVFLKTEIVASAAKYKRREGIGRSIALIARGWLGADPVDLARAQRSATR